MIADPVSRKAVLELLESMALNPNPAASPAHQKIGRMALGAAMDRVKAMFVDEAAAPFAPAEGASFEQVGWFYEHLSADRPCGFLGRRSTEAERKEFAKAEFVVHPMFVARTNGRQEATRELPPLPEMASAVEFGLRHPTLYEAREYATSYARSLLSTPGVRDTSGGKP